MHADWRKEGQSQTKVRKEEQLQTMKAHIRSRKSRGSKQVDMTLKLTNNGTNEGTHYIRRIASLALPPPPTPPAPFPRMHTQSLL